MLALLIVAVLSIACNVPIYLMFRVPSRAPRVVSDVPDYTFDWTGLV